MKRLDVGRLEDVVEFACAECGVRVTIARDALTREPAVLHPVPTCALFDRLDVTSYVRACRLARVAS
jgi:predicted RNA-binding Zn-ribbon protein involved in translation (DUF1610 family)